MRVLVTSPVFPPDLGGPATYVPSVARWLVERGHEVTVLAFCSEKDPRGYPFRVVTVQRGFLPLRYLKIAWHAFRLARRADIVYVNEHLALFHVRAAQLAGTPVVIRIMVDGAWEISHRRGWIGGDDIDTFETREYGWKVRLVRALQKRWWRASRRLIACSAYLRDIPIQRYGVPAEKVRLIYNAYHGPTRMDVRETREEARARLGLANEPRYLLTICRLAVWKGVDVILRAMTELPADVRLLVAGDGEAREAWERLARELGLADRVRFLGNVPYEQIPLLIRASDVFVLDSEYEGLSHTLLEVATLGLPIVCSGVCGNPEVVEHEQNGLLVPPRDPAALRRALERLLADEPLRRRLVETGLARLKRFDRDATFAEVESTLAEAARANLSSA